MAKKSERVKVTLLTSCTVTRNFNPILKIADAPACQTMDELCEWWSTNMAAHRESNPEDMKTPGELYAGASFTAVTEIAQTIGHDNIFIITGGVGMSQHTKKIVPYDFTSDKKAEHNAHQHVSGEKFLPHVWWSKINEALHGDPSPVASRVAEGGVVVGALPKAFIKYLVADLQQIPQKDLEERVFIPIPRSMIGSMPKGIHAAFVPYDASYGLSTPHTRNDKPQRIAQKFIESFETQGGAIASAQEIIDDAKAAAHTQASNAEVDYDELFKEFPSLLETDTVQQALLEAKILGATVGGKHRFAGAWRGHRGTLKIELGGKDHKKALDAMTELLETAKPREYRDDSQLLERIGAFVQTLREAAPDWIFMATDVAKWGSKMYPDDKVLSQPNKITHILQYNAKYLGLEALKIDSKIGYRIAQ